VRCQIPGCRCEIVGIGEVDDEIVVCEVAEQGGMGGVEEDEENDLQKNWISGRKKDYKQRGRLVTYSYHPGPRISRSSQVRACEVNGGRREPNREEDT
jgi:hypothetical protein